MINIFRKKKTDKALSEQLAEVQSVPAPLVPVQMYIVSIITELETINSPPMPKESAMREAERFATEGTCLEAGGELIGYLPPHRIFDIKITKAGDILDS